MGVDSIGAAVSLLISHGYKFELLTIVSGVEMLGKWLVGDAIVSLPVLLTCVILGLSTGIDVTVVVGAVETDEATAVLLV